MYRTGKSYLLNRMLLNRSNGFGVGPTVNPCTKVIFKYLIKRAFGFGENLYLDKHKKETQLTY